MGKSNPNNTFNQNFDGVTAPALPAGWTRSVSGYQSNWVTRTTASSSPPNAVFATDATNVGLTELFSPLIPINLPTAQLTFRNNYNTESGFDGGVLEIKIGAGAFTDILAAGGSFVSGGYNNSISSFYNNPLSGRSAWTGNSSGFITTTVNLPASAAGQNVQFAWRCGSDESFGGTGWYIDTVSITDGFFTCCASPPSITSINVTNNGASILWTAAAGRNYRLQYVDNIL